MIRPTICIIMLGVIITIALDALIHMPTTEMEYPSVARWYFGLAAVLAIIGMALRVWSGIQRQSQMHAWIWKLATAMSIGSILFLVFIC